MYQQSLKNYQRISEFYLDYEQKMKTFYELLDEATRYFNKMNKLNRETIKLNLSLYAQYKAYVDHLQRINQQWMESQWSPFLVKDKAEETENIYKKRKNDRA